MYTFNFTLEHLQVINSALVEYSYKYVAPVIDEINRQLKEQEKKVIKPKLAADFTDIKK